jgi:hypothetical protein
MEFLTHTFDRSDFSWRVSLKSYLSSGEMVYLSSPFGALNCNNDWGHGVPRMVIVPESAEI